MATLTVIPPNASDVGAYRNVVTNEASLLAYFPVDGNTGTVLVNTKDATRDGALELNATYDGRTNDSFGERALSFNFDGDVQIPNNPAYEFPSGNGTIEALVYMSQAAESAPTFFAEAFDLGYPYYALQMSANGSFLQYHQRQPDWPADVGGAGGGDRAVVARRVCF